LIDLDGHRREFTGDRQMVFGKMVWLPDGSGIVFAANPYGPEPQHIFMASYPDGRITRITHEYVTFSLKTLSLSADGNSIFALQSYSSLGFWITTGDLKHATQLPLGGAVYLAPPNSHTLSFDGLRIFYYFSTGERDGIASYDLSSRALVRLTPADLSAVGAYSLSHDGHWITFSALRNGRFGIWVAGTDGGNLRLLVDADLREYEYPVFTADGKEVVFSRHGKEAGLYRIPFAGGRPTRVSNLPLGFPSSTTADGRVLCQYLDNNQSKPKIAIVSLHDGSLVRLFDWTDWWYVMPRFTPDGKNVSYVDDTDGTSNIWSIPVQGGPSRKLTNFTSEMIYEYDWSPDGKQLVLNRGEERSTAVLIQNFRRPTQK
jgi:Tol biopolymer transport system component